MWDNQQKIIIWVICWVNNECLEQYQIKIRVYLFIEAKIKQLFDTYTVDDTM